MMAGHREATMSGKASDAHEGHRAGLFSALSQLSPVIGRHLPHQVIAACARKETITVHHCLLVPTACVADDVK